MAVPTRVRRTTNRRQRFPRSRDGVAEAEVPPSASTGSPHTPIMTREVLRCLQPRRGQVAIDATLGGGGHARALLDHLSPGGRLLAIDLDAGALADTEARLRALGHGVEALVARQASFGDLPALVASLTWPRADIVLADLGVSTMQVDDASRGFHYKAIGTLDLRFDPSRGEPAWAWLARQDVATLTRVLDSCADEPYAADIATRLLDARVTTTHALERVVRTHLQQTHPDLPLAAIKLSVRRTLQALRMSVNDELTALERLLDALPGLLAPGGRVAILTFHSGEDRRVKQAFRDGHRRGVYAAVAREVIRSTMAETRANRRAAAAKLRWAVRAR